MIRIHLDERADRAAARLARLLARTPADPMTPEWIAVPSTGMRRWLDLELARHLGASSPTAGDGITANIRYAFPGTLRSVVLAADAPEDPWSVEHLAWVLLCTLAEQPGDHLLQNLTDRSHATPRYATARRIADLFDRYHVHRPDMVRSWAAGDDLDGAGRRLEPHHLWQPHLWRLVHHRLERPSPPERLPLLLERLRAGDLVLELPPRLVVFGVTVLPGGSDFLELAEAVGTHRDVHVHLLEPSSAANRHVTERLTTTTGARLRSEDRSGEAIRHPLLRSWGRLPRETAVMLHDDHRRTGPDGADAEPPLVAATVEPSTTPLTLLETLQQDLRADRAPTGEHRFDPTDASIQFHTCHGPRRQVEVLRDVLLHLLSAPGSDLVEDDIVIMCPALDRFAPLIEAGLGPCAPDGPGGSTPLDDTRPPALRYRVADRSVRAGNQLLDATVALLDLLPGRFETPTVLDFLAQEPVRARFDFSDDDLARISDWTTDGRIRWGLDPLHREADGVPAAITANTWRAGLDRLLVGTAIHDEALAVGEVVPLPISDQDVELVGRLADLMWRLARRVEDLATPMPVRGWIRWLSTTVDEVFAVDQEDAWQLRSLRQALRGAVRAATVDGEPVDVDIDFADLRALLDQPLRSAPGRPDFFRGGITVTSTTPLRWVPFRVVVLLGMDQEALGAGTVDGDDLMAAVPVLGDRDQRADLRQSLLEAVLAAGTHLVVVRDGRDLRTNHPVPAPVAVAELHDAVVAMLSPEDRVEAERTLEIAHPRQPFDDRCFQPGALVSHTDGPWSFDRSALADAVARRNRLSVASPTFLAEQLDPAPRGDIALSELHAFLRHPVRWFLQNRLAIRLPRVADAPTAVLPTGIEGLDAWQVGERLLHVLLDGGSVADWELTERRLGVLPPGALGDAAASATASEAVGLVEMATGLGLRREPPSPVPVDLTLADGTRVTGTVLDRLDHSATGSRGPVRVGFSRGRPRDHIAAWLDLVALTASEPTTSWRSASVHRGALKARPPEVVVLTPADDASDSPRAAAMHALAVVVDLYRRGWTEPLPLFATLSHHVALGTAKPEHWKGHMRGVGDGGDDANALVFGDIDLDELLALPAHATDPPGTGGRVARFAHLLWDEVGASSVMIDTDHEHRSVDSEHGAA